MDHEKPAMDAEALMRAIEKEHEAMMHKLDVLDKQEARFEKRRKPLPEKIYHVTTRQHAQAILREGLNPAKLLLEDEEVVTLSDDIDFAIAVARITQNTTQNNLVVLDIDTQYLTPSRVHNYLRTAEPDNPNPMDAAAIHEVHYESTIPPEAIHIVKNTK